LFAPLDGLGQGRSQQQLLRRVDEMRSRRVDGAFNVLGAHFDRHGTLKWIETEWSFLPTLREYRRLDLAVGPIDPRRLLRALAGQLAPLHAHGIVHNKVRQDNIYLDGSHGDLVYRLAWLGTELPVEGDWDDPLSQDTQARLSTALNRWARPATRERVATEYLEAVAPEVAAGGPATPAADIYALAAVVVLSQTETVDSREALGACHGAWRAGRLPEALAADARLNELLTRCLQPQPERRIADAPGLLVALE
jgi:hypothetical protein